MSVANDFGLWSNDDFAEYVANKKQAQDYYDKTGKWDLDIYARNIEIRNKYGITEDKYHYTELTSHLNDRIGNIFSKPLLDMVGGGNSSISNGGSQLRPGGGEVYFSSGGGSSGSSGGGSSFGSSGGLGGNFGLGGEQMNTIIGIAVLYMFLSLFKR